MLLGMDCFPLRVSMLLPRKAHDPPFPIPVGTRNQLCEYEIVITAILLIGTPNVYWPFFRSLTTSFVQTQDVPLWIKGNIRIQLWFQTW